MITLSRITSMLFVLLMSFGLTACGGGGGESSSADSDKGSEAEIQDIDSDGDGVNDSDDAFPNDASETTDSDGDGVGDNADVFPNDASETKDTDGDGVGDNADAFPNDASETKDTDGDDVGDNTDIDIDGDGLIEMASLEQLDWIRNNLAGTSLNDGTNNNDVGCPITTGCNGYELTQNVDFDTNGDGVMDANDTYFDYDGDTSNSGWLPIGTEATPFSATFDGNGFEIKNLYINRPSTDTETSGLYIGLFGYIDGSTSTAEIRNIGLTGELMRVIGKEYTGALAGNTQSVSISDIYSAGSVSAPESNGTYVGGLVGYAKSTSINSSYTTNEVSAGWYYVGGLVGRTSGGSIVKSYATGAISGESNVGGLVGYALSSSIIASYATSSVTGDTYIGGLAGYAHFSAVIRASYATGMVTGTSGTGGLVGSGYAAPYIYASYWATDTSGQSLGFGGGINRGEVIDELTIGATLAELKCPTAANNSTCLADETLYSGWDAIDHDNDDTTDPINPWIFGDSNTLPSLSVE